MSSQEPVQITPVLRDDAQPLQQLQQSVAALDTEGREQVRNCLQAIASQMTAAEQLWNSYLDNPEASDDRFTLVMWIGAERARALHRIHLELRTHARSLSECGGVAFCDTIGIASAVDIVEAYDQLQEGESGPQRAEQAVATIAARRQGIEALIAGL